MTQLKDVIHFYLGCECIDPTDGSYYKLKPSNLSNNFQSVECRHKPILRRLDSISLRDSIEMGIPFDILREVVAGKMFHPPMFSKLIQRGFWLFGDEAFEQGLIIDKNKITTP